jgi:hypothetical protein
MCNCENGFCFRHSNPDRHRCCKSDRDMPGWKLHTYSIRRFNIHLVYGCHDFYNSGDTYEYFSLYGRWR